MASCRGGRPRVHYAADRGLEAQYPLEQGQFTFNDLEVACAEAAQPLPLRSRSVSHFRSRNCRAAHKYIVMKPISTANPPLTLSACLHFAFYGRCMGAARLQPYKSHRTTADEGKDTPDNTLKTHLAGPGLHCSGLIDGRRIDCLQLPSRSQAAGSSVDCNSARDGGCSRQGSGRRENGLAYPRHVAASYV